MSKNIRQFLYIYLNHIKYNKHIIDMVHYLWHTERSSSPFKTNFQIGNHNLFSVNERIHIAKITTCYNITYGHGTKIDSYLRIFLKRFKKKINKQNKERWNICEKYLYNRSILNRDVINYIKQILY